MSARCQQSKPKSAPKLGPYSRVLRRGAVGKSIDGRSTEGRYLRDMERQLLDHLGGNPSATERLLIARAARTGLRILLMEIKMDSGTWTDLDARTLSGLQNAFTFMLRSLGLKAPERQQTVDEMLAELRGRI